MVQFLLLGGALFGVNAVFQAAAVPGRRYEIVVTPSRIELLTAHFKAERLRRPSPRELQELVNRYVRQEILNREAISLGLDQDDVVIRERLEQKMEFLLARDAGRGVTDDAPVANPVALADIFAKYRVTIQWSEGDTVVDSDAASLVP